MFSHLSDVFGLSNTVLLEYFQILEVWSFPMWKMHRSLSLCAALPQHVLGWPKRTWPLLLDWVTSWHVWNEKRFSGREGVWIGRKNIWFFWECVPCEMLVRSQKNSPFWGAVGMEGHVPLVIRTVLLQALVSWSSSIQMHMGSVGICAL